MRALLADVDVARDQGLVARFQAGDEAAFDEIYFRYFPLIRRGCERQLGNPHDAEEIAQETFMRALAALPRLGGGQRLYPWLTVIARRLCIDHVRKHGRVRASDDVDHVILDPMDELIENEVDLAHLHAALARMQERHREVLRLREWEELPYDVIADELGVRVGTVQSLLYRARGALRREFLAVAGTLGTVPPAVALWGSLRRVWRRAAAGWAERLPDPSALAAPLAAASLGLVSVIAVLPPDPDPPAPVSSFVVAPAQTPAPDRLHGETPPQRPSGSLAPRGERPAGASPAPAPVAGPTPAPVVQGTPARVYTDEEGIQHAREVSRDHQLFLDVRENAFLGLDPPTLQENLVEKLPIVKGRE